MPAIPDGSRDYSSVSTRSSHQLTIDCAYVQDSPTTNCPGGSTDHLHGRFKLSGSGAQARAVIEQSECRERWRPPGSGRLIRIWQ